MDHAILPRGQNPLKLIYSIWAPKEAYNGWEWWRITPKPKIIEINQALGDTTKLK